MNMSTITHIAENPGKQWYLSQSEICRLLGYSKKYVAAFLREHAIPFYCPIREKRYFLPDVLDAIEKTKWKEARRA